MGFQSYGLENQSFGKDSIPLRIIFYEQRKPEQREVLINKRNFSLMNLSTLISQHVNGQIETINNVPRHRRRYYTFY